MKMRNKIRWVGLAVVMLGVRTAVHASVIAYDGFNYTAGTYATGAGQTSLNGGTGWANNWNYTSTITISNTTLQYGPFANGRSLAVSGNRLSTPNVYPMRTTSSQFSGASQTNWVSLLLNSASDNSN